jgi:tetratricopeptide (TPR) repeat protein
VTSHQPQSPLAGSEEPGSRTRGIRAPRTALWISLTLLLATFAAYFRVIRFGFVSFDDKQYVVANQHLRDGFAARNLHWIFVSFSPDNWFPVTRLSLLLDYKLFGLEAGWYHAENVVIHAVASVLLFGFLRRATQVRWPCAFVAFMFALHPLHVESVAWVAERKDVLCALFWFATLWAWLRYTEKSTAVRYLAALAWFGLGLMAKPMIVTLPFLLLLLDIWPLRRPLSLKLLWEKLPFAALSGAVMWITMQAQHAAMTEPGSATLRAENALISIAAYIADTFWPTRLWAVYSYPASLPAWQAIGVAIALVAISVLVVVQLSKRPFLTTGWFWFLLTLGPVIGLVQVGGQARADRYMYVPMVGLAIMIAWGVAGLVGGRQPVERWCAALGIGACLAMGVLTSEQTKYWKDSDTLFQHAIVMDPQNYLAWDYLGRIVMDDALFPSEALSCFRNALRIRPDYAISHNNIGVILIGQGHVAEAIAEYRESLRIDPELTVGHLNLAGGLTRIGQPLGAINEYEIALSEDPASVQGHISLSLLLANGDDVPEGISHMREALRLEPDDKVAQVLLGQMLMRTPGHLSESIDHFNEALRMDARYAKAHRCLADALLLQGHRQEAIAHLETAQQIEPDPQRVKQLEQLTK